MPLTLDVWRSTKNNATPAENGGYPIPVKAPQTGTFKTFTSASDAVEEIVYRKVNLAWTTDAGKSALLGRVLQFDLPDLDKGLQYSTFILAADQAETEADLVADMGNRLHYGVGWLHQDYTAGDPTLTVRYKSREMIDGATPVLHADGATITDNLHIDSRAVGNSTDTSPTEEAVGFSLGTPALLGDGTWTVVITLDAPLDNSYTVGGAVPVKVQSFPDKEDYGPYFDNLDISSATGVTVNFDLVEGNRHFAWRDEFIVNFSSATAYTVTSQEFGVYSGTGNIGSDYELTNTSDPYFTEKSVTIKAGAIAGTVASGKQLSFSGHQQGVGQWVILTKPASSGITDSSLDFSASAEQGTEV
ncbi:MAG: hypothetical protein JRC99_00035 [Deltaproteobacteria bacterium]|nr:hypothetical protein [Deltaproteobacteria bacterium]